MSAVAETVLHDVPRRPSGPPQRHGTGGGARRWPAATTPSSSRPLPIIGAVLAPDKGTATLPITCMVIGMWFGTLPIGWLARRFDRRFALQCGSLFGMLSGLISFGAVMIGSFWLLLFGTFCGRTLQACCASSPDRFAAADTASEAPIGQRRSFLLLAGGVSAALIGPQLVGFTKRHAAAASVRGELSRPDSLRAARGHRAELSSSRCADRTQARRHVAPA